MSAWWRTTIAVGSSVVHISVDCAVTPKPSGTVRREARRADQWGAPFAAGVRKGGGTKERRHVLLAML